MQGKIDLSSVGTAYKAPSNLEPSREEKLIERHNAHLEESSRWENFAAKVDITQNYHFIHHRHNDLDWQYNIDRYSRYLWKHYETVKYQEDYSKGSKIFGSKSPSRYSEAFSEIATPKNIPRSTSRSRYVQPPYLTEGDEGHYAMTERTRSRTPPRDNSAKRGDALTRPVLTSRRGREERNDTSPNSNTGANKNIFGIDESRISQKDRRTREDRSRSDEGSTDKVPYNSRAEDGKSTQYQSQTGDLIEKGQYEKLLEGRLNGVTGSPTKTNNYASNDSLPKFSQNSSGNKKDGDSPNKNAPKPFNLENRPEGEDNKTTSEEDYDNYTQAKLQEMKTIYAETQANVSNQNKQSKAAIQNLNASNKAKTYEKYMSRVTYKNYVPFSDRKKTESFKTPDKYAKKTTTTKDSKSSETIKKTYLENKDISTEKRDYSQQSQDRVEIQSTNEGITVEDRNGMLAPRRETFGGEIIQIEDFNPDKVSNLKTSPENSVPKGSPKDSSKYSQKSSIKPSPKSTQGWNDDVHAKGQFNEAINEMQRLAGQQDEETKLRSEFRDMLDQFARFEDLYIKMKKTLPPAEATNKVMELSIAFVSAYCTLRGTASKLNA